MRFRRLPQNDCVDNPLLFLIDGDLKKCNWAKNKKDRCNLYGVSIQCPKTCGTCATDRCLDTSLEFNVEYIGNPPKAKVCDWLKN